MTANRFAALFVVALYLSGLAAWTGGYGIPAWIIGAALCVLSLIICLTSKEGTASFNFALILTGGSFGYLVLGAGMFFLNLRESMP